MNGGESERPIVSMRRGNRPSDPVERRGRHVMTPLEGNMAGASKPLTVDTKQPWNAGHPAADVIILNPVRERPAVIK